MKHEVTARAGLAIAWGAVVGATAYALLRVLAPASLPVATVSLSAHVPLFSRWLIAGYAGGFASFVAMAAATQNEALLVRALAPSLVVAASALAAQALLVP
jgi:hypothetical protein